MYEVVEYGEVVENPEVEFVAEDEGIVEFDGNNVIAVGEGSTTVSVTYKDKSVTLSITVLPNYVGETFDNSVSLAVGTTYELYNGEEEIGGRKEGIYKYVTGDTHANGYWSHRIVNSKSALNAIDAYKENGYKYFAFDLYLTGNARFLAPIGGSGDTFYAPFNEYFDVDGLKVIADGKVTNKFEANKWLTIVYDVRERIMIDPAANMLFYLALDGSNFVSYIDNIRYYLDSEFMPEAGILSYEEKRGASKVLRMAAMTYVAALAMSLAQLLRLILRYGGRRDE